MQALPHHLHSPSPAALHARMVLRAPAAMHVGRTGRAWAQTCAGIGLACALLAPALPAHAGILEAILANKTVQQLMVARPQDLNQENALCTQNPQVRQANAARCEAVANAVRMQSVPLELRTVMANPTSAAALRELCVASFAVAQANYLCVELGKGDGTLATEIQNRLLIQAAGDQRP